MKALKSSLKPFVKFAEGLFEDYSAVLASMMTTVSNAPVEGLNNRLKMLKRQMYGRAGLELLTKVLFWLSSWSCPVDQSIVHFHQKLGRTVNCRLID